MLKFAFTFDFLIVLVHRNSTLDSFLQHVLISFNQGQWDVLVSVNFLHSRVDISTSKKIGRANCFSQFVLYMFGKTFSFFVAILHICLFRHFFFFFSHRSCSSRCIERLISSGQWSHGSGPLQIFILLCLFLITSLKSSSFLFNTSRLVFFDHFTVFLVFLVFFFFFFFSFFPGRLNKLHSWRHSHSFCNESLLRSR